jgi:hypothetical protein
MAKVEEYQQMMAWLTRPKSKFQEPRIMDLADGGRIGFAKAKLVQKRGEAANIERAEKSVKAIYEKFGKKKVDAASIAKHGVPLDQLPGGRGDYRKSNFIRRITEHGGDFPTAKEARIASRGERVLREQKLQINILEELKKGPTTVEALAKKFKTTEKEIKAKGDRLLKNIYNKNVQMGKGVERGLKWIPADDVIIDKILKNISKTPKLAVIQRDQIGRLFYDAFGREKLSNGKKNPTYNPKKYKAILDNLKEYDDVKNIIKTKYPKLKIDLDHPLSKSTLRNLFNASADQLVYVNPLEANLNNSLKKALSTGYEKSITGKNIEQKKAIEKIAKDLNINIGKVTDDASKFKYGVKTFEKLDMPQSIVDTLKMQANLSKNLKTYAKQNPELFKTANVDVSKMKKITKVTDKQIDVIVKKMKEAGIPCIKGVGGQCTSIVDYQKGYNKIVKEAADGKGSKQAISKLANFTKGMRKLKGAATWTGYGLLAEAGFMVPFAIADYAAGKSWKRIVGNATDYGFGPIFGQSELEEFKEYLPKGSAAVQRRNIMELGERLYGMEQQKVNPGYGRVGYSERAPEQRQKVYDDLLDEYILNMQPFMRPSPHTEQGQFYDQGLMDKAEQQDIDTMKRIEAANQKRIDERIERGIIADRNWQSQVSYAGGGIAAIRRPHAIPPKSGPNPQGLPSIYNRVKRI